MSTTKRYHPLLVTLHWLIAILIFATAFFAIGFGEGERGRGFITIAGLQPIAIHMLLGILTLVLLIIRLVVRWLTKKPDWASTGSAFLDKIGGWTHAALYFFAFAITITGITLALQTNRLARVFGLAGTTNQLGGGFPAGGFPGQFGGGGPSEFGEGFRGGGLRLGLGAFHGLSWILLALLILLHIGAALYHQFIRKDHLFGRMWFGKQTE
jgi:cytochrome b561